MAKQVYTTLPGCSLDIHSFIQKVLFKHLECAKHYLVQSGFSSEKKKKRKKEILSFVEFIFQINNK